MFILLFNNSIYINYVVVAVLNGIRAVKMGIRLARALHPVF